MEKLGVFTCLMLAVTGGYFSWFKSHDLSDRIELIGRAISKRDFDDNAVNFSVWFLRGATVLAIIGSLVLLALA